MTEHAPTRRVADPRTVAIAGLSTVAWYAVPDVVRPRWARALAKTAVATAAVVLTFTSTTEGDRGARGPALPARRRPRGGRGRGRRDARDRDGRRRPAGGQHLGDGRRRHHAGAGRRRRRGHGGRARARDDPRGRGEKWVYRRGERLRDRGVRLPHTRVGLAVGALAVALAAAEPLLWNAGER